LKLHARDTENWHKAMVTKGGIPPEEINPKTLESRLTPGLFFAGETIDLDGPCGGYNIQWALSSGALCAQSIK
jgi:predicted flavoprotein YhiN